MTDLVVDTSVVVALIADGEDKTPERERRAALQLLGQRETRLWLPTPALAEVMAPAPTAMVTVVARRLEETFRLVNFDRGCALQMAGWLRVMRAHRKQAPDPTVSGPALKVDLMILACAVHLGMDGLCVLDGAFVTAKRQLQLGIEVGPPSQFVR